MKITDLAAARALDAQDPMSAFRKRFHFPTREDDREVIYFCGNSLGLQPKSTRAQVLSELDHWATFGVDGHFEGSGS